MENKKHHEVYFEKIQYVIFRINHQKNICTPIAILDERDEAIKKLEELKKRGITCDILKRITSGIAKYDVLFLPF